MGKVIEIGREREDTLYSQSKHIELRVGRRKKGRERRYRWRVTSEVRERGRCIQI